MRQFGTKPDPHRRQRRVLRAVAAFEFFKGIFVVLMGVCALAQLFLDFADTITDARLWAAARFAFAYAALRFTESYGLWKGRTWAEWVALISGALLLPWEVREIMRGITPFRVALFVFNLAIVFYMLYVILANRRERENAKAASI